MIVGCEVTPTTLEGGRGGDRMVEGVEVACSRCNHKTESFGTGEASIRRCFALLREECPKDERNIYETHEHVAAQAWLDTAKALPVPSPVCKDVVYLSTEQRQVTGVNTGTILGDLHVVTETRTDRVRITSSTLDQVRVAIEQLGIVPAPTLDKGQEVRSERSYPTEAPVVLRTEWWYEIGVDTFLVVVTEGSTTTVQVAYRTCVSIALGGGHGGGYR